MGNLGNLLPTGTGIETPTESRTGTVPEQEPKIGTGTRTGTSTGTETPPEQPLEPMGQVIAART